MLNLRSSLSDGSELWRGGIVTEASADDADGGFARYRLVIEPWLGLLAHTRRSQVWQEKSLTGLYSAHASWRWADCVQAHLDQQ